MDSIDDRRFAAWLDLTTALVRCPGHVFPRAVIMQALSETFGTAVAWNWMTSDGSWGLEVVNAHADLLDAAEREYWKDEKLLNHHPLVRWYQVTLDPTAMSMDRVPDEVAPRREREQVRERLRPLELDEQLSIPYQLDACEHLAFVLGRTGDAFHGEDLELAKRIQPLICLVARQYAVLTEVHAHDETPAPCELTGRELAVLTLVAQGRTARAIGHRLGISPRTVHKHLEHVYAKLGVADRLTAVLVARQMGLCPQDAEVDLR